MLRCHVWGVYARDQVPIRLLPGGYIANTENADRKGEHWISLSVNGDYSVEFVDSLAQIPIKYDWEFTSPWTYNSQRIQPPNSGLCGGYCLYYLFFKSRGLSMSHIMQSLPNLSGNDATIRHFLSLLNK